MTDNDDGLSVEPVTDATATAADAAALALIQDYSARELPRMQARAEKWIAGLAAITGVLTTAIVIKGPETFTKLTDSRPLFGQTLNPKDWIIGLMLLGGTLLGLGVALAYNAAHGSPLDDSNIDSLARDPTTAAGAASKWRAAVKSAAECARSNLRKASYCTVAGTLVLALAVLLTWTTPEQEDTPRHVCIALPEGVTELATLPPIVKGELRVVPCP